MPRCCTSGSAVLTPLLLGDLELLAQQPPQREKEVQDMIQKLNPRRAPVCHKGSTPVQVNLPSSPCPQTHAQTLDS